MARAPTSPYESRAPSTPRRIPPVPARIVALAGTFQRVHISNDCAPRRDCRAPSGNRERRQADPPAAGEGCGVGTPSSRFRWGGRGERVGVRLVSAVATPPVLPTALAGANLMGVRSQTISSAAADYAGHLARYFHRRRRSYLDLTRILVRLLR